MGGQWGCWGCRSLGGPWGRGVTSSPPSPDVPMLSPQTCLTRRCWGTRRSGRRAWRGLRSPAWGTATPRPPTTGHGVALSPPPSPSPSHCAPRAPRRPHGVPFPFSCCVPSLFHFPHPCPLAVPMPPVPVHGPTLFLCPRVPVTSPCCVHIPMSVSASPYPCPHHVLLPSPCPPVRVPAVSHRCPHSPIPIPSHPSTSHPAVPARCRCHPRLSTALQVWPCPGKPYTDRLWGVTAVGTAPGFDAGSSAVPPGHVVAHRVPPQARRPAARRRAGEGGHAALPAPARRRRCRGLRVPRGQPRGGQGGAGQRQHQEQGGRWAPGWVGPSVRPSVGAAFLPHPF